VRVIGIAWQPDAPQLRRIALGEHGHAVEALLAVPDRAITSSLDVGDR
jgi:hypothetical protein